VSSGTAVEDLDRWQLATLGREYLLAGHLIDRAGMPHVIAAAGREVMEAVAIDEWMGASPVYTRRVRRLLGFDHELDVSSTFKGMQFDIGAPHEFLDFRFSVSGPDRGEFHLAHCGALVDVEPMGEDFVHGMCHTIEDPTFEATVCASNPRARMVPVHRPPRVPADRRPHCAWEVVIDPGASPRPEPAPARRIARTRAAELHVPVLPLVPAGEGRSDYAGPVDPDLRLEDFSREALLALVREFALQGHLLAMSFHAAVASRVGPAEASTILARQFTGVAGLVAGRLARALGASADAAGVATVLELHPAFAPRDYVDVWVDGDGETVVAVGDCPATEETEALGWATLLADGLAAPALDAMVGAVDPSARCEPVEPPMGRIRAWRVLHGGDPRPEPADVALARFSAGADFEFVRIGPR